MGEPIHDASSPAARASCAPSYIERDGGNGWQVVFPAGPGDGGLLVCAGPDFYDHPWGLAA